MTSHATSHAGSQAGSRTGFPPADDGTDRLQVLGLEARGFHGVLDFERQDGQVFRVDLTLGLDTAPAARSDDLRDTVDYGTLSTKVRAIIEGEPVDLIETLAHRIAAQCLLETPVQWVEVTVHKPDAPIEATFADVALTIRRSRGRAEDD
jgi:dihydroneopterin aldolase